MKLFRLSPLQAALAVASLAACPGAAQESAGYEITEIRHHIEGITRPWAIDRVLDRSWTGGKDGFDLRVGIRFASRQELDAAVKDRTQLLINQRALETARIEVAVEPRPGLPDAVGLDVYTKDTWNLIALPYLKYDSTPDSC